MQKKWKKIHDPRVQNSGSLKEDLIRTDHDIGSSAECDVKEDSEAKWNGRTGRLRQEKAE